VQECLALSRLFIPCIAPRLLVFVYGERETPLLQIDLHRGYKCEGLLLRSSESLTTGHERKDEANARVFMFGIACRVGG
jgi:hypothetical protein